MTELQSLSPILFRFLCARGPAGDVNPPDWPEFNMLKQFVPDKPSRCVVHICLYFKIL